MVKQRSEQFGKLPLIVLSVIAVLFIGGLSLQLFKSDYSLSATTGAAVNPYKLGMTDEPCTQNNGCLSKHCVSALGKPKKCLATQVGDSCARSAQCEDNAACDIINGRVCRKLKGSSCTRNSGCLSNVCRGGVCSASSNLCIYDKDCNSGKCGDYPGNPGIGQCTGGVTEDNQPCTRDANCLSGDCDNRKCAKSERIKYCAKKSDCPGEEICLNKICASKNCLLAA